jgi:uncharacterized membrane protein
MTKSRLEAFSDGVIAIIITIMVLELRPPQGTRMADLAPLLPSFLSYMLSFVMIGIYWGNHHHLLHTVGHVNSRIIWANLHLLFWLSLIPFVTAWNGEHPFEKDIMILYALALLACGIAYYILIWAIETTQKHSPALAAAIRGQSRKGIWSLVAYLSAVAAAFWEPRVTGAIFVAVALMWLVPDRNIERTLGSGTE